MREVLTALEFIKKYGQEKYDKQSNAAKFRMKILDCYISDFGLTKDKAIDIYKTSGADEKFKGKPKHYINYDIKICAQEFLIIYNNYMSMERRYDNVI